MFPLIWLILPTHLYLEINLDINYSLYVVMIKLKIKVFYIYLLLWIKRLKYLIFYLIKLKNYIILFPSYFHFKSNKKEIIKIFYKSQRKYCYIL